MKISMWIIASKLEAYEPLLSIKEGNANIEGVRIYDGDLSTFTTVFAYVGNAADIFSDASFAQTVLVVSGLDYILIPNQTVDTVLNELLDIIDCYNQWERRLLKVSGEENGLQQLIDLGEQMLDYPIHLVDLNGNILAESEKCEDAEIRRQWQRDYKNGALSISHSILPDGSNYEKFLEWMGRSKAFEMESGSRCIVTYIYINEIAQAILYVQQTDQPFGLHHLQIADVLCKVVTQSIHLSNNSLNLQVNALILSNLLEGNEADPEVCSQLTNYSWSMPWYLLIVKRTEDISNIRLMSKFRMPDIVVMSTIYRDNIVMVIGGENLERFVSHLQSVQSVAKSFSVGVSLPFSSWNNLDKIYRQAEFALEHTTGSTDIAYCNDYAFEHLVGILNQYDKELTLCHPAIKILSVYDEKNQSDYLETLRQYVLNNRNLAATASALHLHRNSLLYRIKRISELIGSELTDPDEIMFIYLSFKLKQYASEENTKKES